MRVSNYQKRKSRGRSRDMSLYPKRKAYREKLYNVKVTAVDLREATSVEIKPIKCDFLTEGLE